MRVMYETIYQVAASIIPLIVAIVVHEISHGWMASALGDPTAGERGRLSLNPLRHVDPIGTIILPGFLKLVGAPVFGWAKPVPVDARRLRNPRYGMMAVAAAGPGSNLLLAGVGAIGLGLLAGTGAAPTPGGALGFLGLNLLNLVVINLFLALFNLLPLPPFDGSQIVEGLLPRAWVPGWERLRPLGFPIVFVLLIVVPWAFPGLRLLDRIILPPFQWLAGNYLGLAAWIAQG